MTIKLRRQSLIAYGTPLVETVVDCPQPQGSEVLVRVERCGVCHSDLHMQDGYFRLAGDKKLDITSGRALPFTLGHEIAGVIDATNAGILAAQIIGLSDSAVAAKLKQHKQKLAEGVEEKSRKLQQSRSK